MEAYGSSWNEILEEMIPRGSECDVCVPPLDIGPPPPLPANFREKAVISGSCNVCSTISDVDIRPIRVPLHPSLLPVAATFMVGSICALILIGIILFKVKKCQAFRNHGVCWIFPRNVLPHTELAPSSLPSPSPSMEKLRGPDIKRHWQMSSNRSLQSENIYEVCSPPSPDSLYEEVGPRSEISPYGVVMVDNSTKQSFGSHLEPVLVRNIALPTSRFSTFGGNGAHGFVNPVVSEARMGSQTLKSGFRPRVQKRELPPVPGNNY